MKLILAAVAALALSGPAFAQAGHEMSKMPGMDHSTPAAGAQGAGVIKKLDAKGGSVTLQHGPIAALSWPAMTMAFKADPALLKDLIKFITGFGFPSAPLGQCGCYRRSQGLHLGAGVWRRRCVSSWLRHR